jgi:DNA-binding NarL/FixJ family response regulator
MKRITIIGYPEIVRNGLFGLISASNEYSVTFFSDPVAFIKHTWAFPPDLVIMDQVVPSMNCVEAIKEIKKHWGKCKILFCCYSIADEDIQKAFKAGVSGYIFWDASSDEILLSISQILSGHYYVTPLILSIILNKLCQNIQTLQSPVNASSKLI